MDRPAEFGIFPNRGGRGGLVDLESKVSAAEKKFQSKREGGGVEEKISSSKSALSYEIPKFRWGGDLKKNNLFCH